jgi:hypothetical protein
MFPWPAFFHKRNVNPTENVGRNTALRLCVCCDRLLSMLEFGPTYTLMLIVLPLTGFVLSERAIAGDICGTLTLEQCKQAYKEAIERRERSSGKNVSVGLFQTVYIDHHYYSNLSWGKMLSGTYSNGCEADGKFDSNKCTFEIREDGSRQVRVDDSNAAKACKAVGGRLPTKPEYESLIRNFNHSEENYGPALTVKGMAEMKGSFRDMNRWFWTSSVGLHPCQVTHLCMGASVFDGNGGQGVVGPPTVGREATFAVRCVADR